MATGCSKCMWDVCWAATLNVSLLPAEKLSLYTCNALHCNKSTVQHGLLLKAWYRLCCCSVNLIMPVTRMLHGMHVQVLEPRPWQPSPAYKQYTQVIMNEYRADRARALEASQKADASAPAAQAASLLGAPEGSTLSSRGIAGIAVAATVLLLALLLGGLIFANRRHKKRADKDSAEKNLAGAPHETPVCSHTLSLACH
jgi:hypothetical protein